MKIKLLVLTAIVGFSMLAPTLQASCRSCHTDRSKCEERMVCKKKHHCKCDAKHWTHHHCKGMRSCKLNQDPHSSK